MSFKGTQHGSWGREAGGIGVLAAKHLNKCQMTTHHARYRVCGYYIYDFPTLNRFYLFLYKKRLSPMSSCAPDAFNTFKNAKFYSSLINVCQPSNHAWFWVCRDYNYDFPTLDCFVQFLYRKDAPSEQLCSPRTLHFINENKMPQFIWPMPAEPSCTILD